ncbi:WD40 repeat-like protein [Suillus brevipes Sb2]|nr:WD40 repeat-like protein [Suillus brevipes Sb2]
MNPESKIMQHPASAKHEQLATKPYRKIKVNRGIGCILHLPGQRIIIYSQDGLIRVWDLETGKQVGEKWEVKYFRVETIAALSPDSKKVASGGFGGAVKLWNVDTGKIIKIWKGHTRRVRSLSWSPDGGRVVSGSEDGTFRVWDVQSGKTILGPINAAGEGGLGVRAACYSPDAKTIATGGKRLKIWDANSGVSLKSFEERSTCLAWTSDGKTLITGPGRLKIDTATWTVLLCEDYVNAIFAISVNSNVRIFATTSYFDKTAQLWNLKTKQPIGTPLHHPDYVVSGTFSADEKFLVTRCRDDHIYTWDISAIVKRAGLAPAIVSIDSLHASAQALVGRAGLAPNIADVTLRPAPKMTGARRLPPGFFDDALREANLRIRLSQSHAPPTPTPHQRSLGPFTSVWRRSKPHGATQPTTQSQSRPFSWTQNISGVLHRRDRSDIQLQEVEVPCTAGKPRNYHAKKKKPAASSSRPPQQPSGAAQSIPSSSRLPPQTTTTSTPSAVPGITGATGTVSSPHITGAGWRASFVAWICCMPIQSADGHH